MIVGGGTMGLILAVLLDLRGVGPITVVELDPARRALAPSLVGVEACGPDELGDREWELVVDATGSPDAIADRARARRAGRDLPRLRGRLAGGNRQLLAIPGLPA